MAKFADMYFKVDPWKIIEEGFDPAYSRVSESVFSLGNESLGVRGCFDEGGSTDSLRGSYNNGVYDIEQLNRSYRGIIRKTHFMIPSAEWMMVSITVDGEKLDLGSCAFSDFRRELDMQSGCLSRSFIWHTGSDKKLKVSFLRFLDMINRERAYQRITLESPGTDCDVVLETGMSFNTVHEGRSRCFWTDTRAEISGSVIELQSRTTESGQEVYAAAVTSLPGEPEPVYLEKGAMLRSRFSLKAGEPVCIDKRVVILFDGSPGEVLWEKGRKCLEDCSSVSLDEAMAAQHGYWADYWAISDISLVPSGSDEESLAAVSAEQQGIRFCSFQLAQTYNGGSMRHNIGAKGLTGEAYNGHAFWDTEACCLPFYLFTKPEAAKALLLFRYNTLPEAIERAGMLDCRGACYPIATLNGDEACNLWQHASLQLQPSSAVAYGIWHYVHTTDDRDFLWNYGAEMLIQISRFLADRAAKSGSSGKYGFYGVMGPDEFHMMVNNNAYTNYMGMRTFDYTCRVLLEMKELHPEAYSALAAKVRLGPDEPGHWRELADNMYLPVTEDGLFEQHDGYFDLPHTDIASIPVSEFPLYDHWSYDRIYRTDMIKQPDVLMFLYLYNSSFTEETKRRNYCFYEPRTIHESSLSPAIHSILAAELGLMDEAVNFFGYATRLDLDNYNRNTHEGLHITSIAMAWANIVYGFAGLRSDGELLGFAPRLPGRWKQVSSSITYKGRIIRLTMNTENTVFSLVLGEPLELNIYGERTTLGRDGLTVQKK